MLVVGLVGWVLVGEWVVCVGCRFLLGGWVVE